MERIRISDDDLQPRASKAAVKDVQNIFDKVVVLEITFHRPGIRRKADLALVATDADKRLLGLTKAIVDRKEYTAVCRVANETRNWLSKRCLLSPLKRGTYLVPIGIIGDVEDRLAQTEACYDVKANEFLAVYPRLREEAKERLADQFEESNYPSVRTLDVAFYVDRQFLDFGVPSAEKLGTELWRAEKARAEQTWRSAVDEIQAALRESFRDLVSHLAERLEPATDGKRKIFKETAVANVNEFIDLFKNRNLTGDAELEGLVIQARAVLKGVRAKSIRNNDVKRGEIAEEMGRVKTALDKLLVEAPRRKITFED